MDIEYADLINRVLPYLAADPSYPVTESAIKRAVIEFCAGSWIWHHIPANIDVVAGQAAYDLTPPAGTDITTVMDVAFNAVPLTNKSVTWLDNDLPGWRTTQHTPKHYTQITTEGLILAPVPESNITGGLSLSLVLQPSQDSTGFPSWICNQFIYTLVDGALAALMLTPQKTWSDAANGAFREGRFRDAISNARASAAFALGRAAGISKSQH